MKNLRFWILILLCINVHLGLSQSFDQYIQASSDDAEEKFDGSYVTTSSSDIEVVYDSWNSQGLQVVGLRFDNVTIPSNSLITSAYIQFTADGSSSGDVTITIKGEDAAFSNTFAESASDISNRTTTAAEVVWDLVSSWSDNLAGPAQRSPNLSSIVNEVITSNGWLYGNPISFMITGTGGESDYREAVSFDEDPTKAAQLVIEYTSLAAVDLAITSFITPTDFNYPSSTSLVQVEIESFGNLAADSYTVSYSINENLIATEPGTVPLTLGQSTVFMFPQTADLSTIDTYTFSAEVTILDDEDLSNNSIVKNISVVDAIDTLFFAQGSAWRYWDSVSNPGLTWNTIDHNDSLWTVGLGHIGFGEGDELTEINGGLSSYYFRKKVALPDVDQLNTMYMHIVHDDAAIVYVNGEEVFRSELMPLGTIGHLTTARQSNNSTNENDFYTYEIDPSYFVSGLNIVAVSVRNEEASDGDLSFDCYLTPDFLYDQDGPYVYYEGSDILVQEVTPEGLVSNTFASEEGLLLTCTLPHMNTSFSFSLKPEINIEPSEYNFTPEKFLALSDFDGHIEGFTMTLQGEGVIDEDFNWTYGEGHLIICGDVFDRGFHITESLWLLYKLESEAEAAGGKVHYIVGNHEMFNMTDDWRYAEVKYFDNAQLMGRRMSELYDSETELGRWLRSKNVIERIGDYAFTHGGISPQVAALSLTYDQMNDYGRMEMDGLCTSNACATVTGTNGVYWYRGMVDEELTQVQVDDFVDSLGVERLIVGHTKDNTIQALYEGRVLVIDVYHVDNFEDGYMEALQFEMGCFYKFLTSESVQTYTLLDVCDDYINVLEVGGEDHFRIYPNPTAGVLNINLPRNLLGIYFYSIVNLEGQLVSSGEIRSEVSTMDVGAHAAGKYYLILQNSIRTISEPFIIVD
jgi:hypothetical protein